MRWRWRTNLKTPLASTPPEKTYNQDLYKLSICLSPYSISKLNCLTSPRWKSPLTSRSDLNCQPCFSLHTFRSSELRCFVYHFYVNTMPLALYQAKHVKPDPYLTLNATTGYRPPGQVTWCDRMTCSQISNTAPTPVGVNTHSKHPRCSDNCNHNAWLIALLNQQRH